MNIVNEPIAAKRKFPIFLADSTGAGIALPGDIALKVSKDGAAFAAANGSTTITARTGGQLGSAIINFAAADWDTVGILGFQITGTGIGLHNLYEDGLLLQATPLALYYGTVQSATSGTVRLGTDASSSDDFYAGSGNQTCLVRVIAGTGAGQFRVAYDYTGSTRALTLLDNWVTQPDATSIVEVLPISAELSSGSITAIQSGLATATALTSAQTDITTIVAQTLRALGLLGDNIIIDGGSGLEGPVFTSDNVCTSARRRQFASKAAADAATYGAANNADSEIARWELAATDISDGQWKKLKNTRSLP
jgi:hypothetical protein